VARTQLAIQLDLHTAKELTVANTNQSGHLQVQLLTRLVDRNILTTRALGPSILYRPRDIRERIQGIPATRQRVDRVLLTDVRWWR
jgi:hypothetical protein